MLGRNVRRLAGFAIILVIAEGDGDHHGEDSRDNHPDGDSHHLPPARTPGRSVDHEDDTEDKSNDENDRDVSDEYRHNDHGASQGGGDRADDTAEIRPQKQGENPADDQQSDRALD